MPRLNYGTLLENIVVLETMRVGLERSHADAAVGLATAFAMPSLTECWCKLAEASSNPWFNHNVLRSMLERQHPAGSLKWFWSLCLKNEPNLPVQPFYRTEGVLKYQAGGPNGALLAAMLAVRRRREVHLWVNDNGERYDRRPGGRRVRDAREGTLDDAALLLKMRAAGTCTEVPGSFPDTIGHLQGWLHDGDRRRVASRVGFLDPDNYAEGTTQVSSHDHRHWLRVMANGSECVLSVMFSGCQNRGPGNTARNQRLALFHDDEVSLYPRSLVFEYGNFQTGVKVRWPAEGMDDVAAELQDRIQASWREWHPSLNSLAAHVDGGAAS
jgi:hypothetical protein